MKFALWVMAVLAAAAWAAEPVPIIFDTDMGNDVDDALALASLHALETRGEARLLAVTITKDNRWAAPFVEVVNRYYGRGGIPIGVVRDGVTRDDGNYTRPVVEKTMDPSKANAPHPLAEAVLRRTLAAQPDGTVVLVQTGFSTNLARLLDSGADENSPLAGRELIRRKVKLLVTMAGCFFTSMAEYNVVQDIASARKLFAEWPTKLVTSGFEIGGSILYPAARLATDFGAAPQHPVAEAYRLYRRMPYDEPLWDPTAVLYAVRPEAGYFGLSQAGRIVVDEGGRTTFEEGAGNQHYLTVNDVQRGRVLEAIAALMSQPAGRCH